MVTTAPLFELLLRLVLGLSFSDHALRKGSKLNHTNVWESNSILQYLLSLSMCLLQKVNQSFEVKKKFNYFFIEKIFIEHPGFGDICFPGITLEKNYIPR